MSYFPTRSNKTNVAIIYTVDITHKNQFCMAYYHIREKLASAAIMVQITLIKYTSYFLHNMLSNFMKVY